MTEKAKVEVSDIRGIVATPSQVSEFLQHVMRCNLKAVKEGRGDERLVPCIWGPAGIAKTSLVKQLGKVGVELVAGERVYPHVVHIALAQVEEAGDIQGLPVSDVDATGRTIMNYAPPFWWPTPEQTENGKKPVILLFDDFNRADPRILKAIMQILQDYKSNSHSLPDNCHIMLTGNPPSGDDGTEYMVNEIDKAILTRMIHITMKFDRVDWARWANTGGVDPRVISFVLGYGELVSGEGSSRTNPRSVVQFSNLIKDLQDLKSNADLVHMLALSAMDETVAVMFEKFVIGDMQKLVAPEEILNDWPSAEKKLDQLKKRSGGKDGETKLRADLMGITVDRLYVHLMQDNLKLDKKHFDAFVSFIQRTDLISEDLMYTLLRRLRRDGKTPEQKKLMSDMVHHGGDVIADLIMKIT